MDIDSEIKQFLDSQFSTPDKSIYHYTTEEGYNQICRCEYLKLNSHRVLNKKDPMNKELETGYKLIKSQLNDNEQLCKYISIFDEFVCQGIIIYTASLSTTQSNYLANKYGNFCLEFNNNISRNFQENNHILFANVVYVELFKLKVLIKILTEF